MSGQHRKRAAGRKFTVLAACGVVAALAVVLCAAMGTAPEARHAAVDSPSSAVETDPAPATVPSTAQQAPAVAAAGQSFPSAKAAQQHPPPPPPPVPCSTELAGARPHVAQVGNLLKKTFAVADVGGAVGRGDGDHGAGLALDFMTPDPARGDAIAEFVLANQQRFGVTYVIWRQRYNDGSGWSYLEDRGSPTANHYDHVHVSFDQAAHGEVTC
ncbi:hypothetical protein U3653_18270 [Nocardia sp. CDC186]|uniref:ARB-07466-like C-terminal domain-containing protein n=1 Tax=Nocardia implantans TaxID=3108168 RepID=A0ABU6AWW9_9NOCA|nr:MULTISPECIES: hypothetical protein [unclassified Nocardia]MBF6193868.1 hypothetical protein [Nocardia beijingensis]MEA3529393.1 hypothetical protein [Nocardia sp. CDC192]MEB3511979.1 hypothetical protein [Nocardia sp. CDC186]